MQGGCGLRHILARLIQLANFLVHLHEHFGGRLQLLGNVSLRVGRELSAGGHAVLKFLPDLAELLRHSLCEKVHLLIDVRVYCLALLGDGSLHLLPGGG